MDWFRTTCSILDNTHPQRDRAVRTKDATAAVEQSIEEDPNESICHRAKNLNCAQSLYG